MSAPEQPRRLTPTERAHEITMAAIQRAPREPESQVDLSLNAKGDVQIAVTVRGADAADCRAQAQAIFDGLRASYPRSEPTPDAEALKEARRVNRVLANKAKAGRPAPETNGGTE